MSERMRRFVDVLIPGDELFPAASVVEVDRLLIERLPMLGDAEAIAHLEAALGDLAAMPPEACVAAVAAWEAADPEAFGRARTVAYLSYYAQPAVRDAIRRLGIAYNDAPQPAGYALAPWDLRPAPEGDTPLPTVSRFTYKRTDEIVPIPHAISPEGEAPR